jgi:hypothetical protein
MIDLPSASIAALRDPLFVTLCVFSLFGLLSHFLFRRQPLGRALVRIVFLSRTLPAFKHKPLIWFAVQGASLSTWSA